MDVFKEFTFEAAVRMRDRFLQQEVWERLGVPVKEAVSVITWSPERQLFQRMLFAKIVPNCRLEGYEEVGIAPGRIEIGAACARAEDLKSRHAMATADFGKSVALFGNVSLHGSLPAFRTMCSYHETSKNAVVSRPASSSLPGARNSSRRSNLRLVLRIFASSST